MQTKTAQPKQFNLPGGEGGTRFTLDQMARLVRRDVADPELRQWVMSTLRGIPGHSFEKEVERLFEIARDFITYRRDAYSVEQVSAARRTLANGYGDCDDKSVLLATLLGCAGHAARFVVISQSAKGWDHVFVEALVRGKWVPLDPTPETARPGQIARHRRIMRFPIYTPGAEINDLGFLKKIGRGFKKVGKGIGKGAKKIGKAALKVAPIAAGFIPGVGQFASLIPTGGGGGRGGDDGSAAIAAAANEEIARLQAQVQQQQQIRQLESQLRAQPPAPVQSARPAIPGAAGVAGVNTNVLLFGAGAVGLLALLALRK